MPIAYQHISTSYFSLQGCLVLVVLMQIGVQLIHVYIYEHDKQKENASKKLSNQMLQINLCENTLKGRVSNNRKMLLVVLTQPDTTANV